MRLNFCCADTDPAPWLNALRTALPQCEVHLWQSGAPVADVGVVWAPPQRFFDEQPQLRAVFNIGAGVDRLLALRLPPSLQLVRLQDAGMAAQMAQYVCHALLHHVRAFDAYAAQAHEARWWALEPPHHAQVGVGVLGLGALGAHVARCVAQLGYPVHGWSRQPRQVEGVLTHHGPDGLRALLRASRVLVCLLPLTPDTHDLLNRETLSQLPSGSYLINVARGAHLVEQDLLALLESGHLAGATLDVFRTEPLPAFHPFWRHPRIRITPHISARTLLHESVAQIAAGVQALQRGEAPAGLVDRALGY